MNYTVAICLKCLTSNYEGHVRRGPAIALLRARAWREGQAFVLLRKHVGWDQTLVEWQMIFGMRAIQCCGALDSIC